MLGSAPQLDVGAPAELRTTHASWVFLANGDAWKLKRPVDLGFLDFLSPEARHRFCEEEVRLNRRLAPDVYLGVEPVRRSPRGLSLTGEGAPVDWAVHMKRLADGDAAPALLARGQLGPDELARLAARLAAFHVAARETPEAGTAAALRVNLDENFAQTERFVGGELLDRRTFEETRAWQTEWLAGHGDLLRARVAAGRIREGHGDLRLEHVYFPSGGRGEPIVIDCIEFSERLRCGDVAGDVAFLAMELDAARRPDLAAGFLARFAEASDDLRLYGVLDFYLSYRAWVRGKVAAFVADDASLPADARRAKAAEARARFALARSYAGRPADDAFVVAVGGLPGSGKSTLAAALGRALAAPVVSSDRTRKALAGIAPTERGPSRLYTDANRDAVYAEILAQAGGVVAAGRGVVLDATFSTPVWRQAAAAVARSRRARFALVEVGCADRGVLAARLATRRSIPSLSDATDAELEALVDRYVPPAQAEELALVRVDGAAPIEAVASAALAGLQRHGIESALERRRS